MPIWTVAPVDQQPQLSLLRWRIMETQSARHFVGWCIENGEGRVSTEIQTFDRNTRKGKTRSGRVYTLVGEPRLDRDALYVWEYWMSVNGIDEFRDVTDAVIAEGAGDDETDDR